MAKFKVGDSVTPDKMYEFLIGREATDAIKAGKHLTVHHITNEGNMKLCADGVELNYYSNPVYYNHADNEDDVMLRSLLGGN